MATVVAATSTVTVAHACKTTSLPALAVVAPAAAYRYKSEIKRGCAKISGAQRVCELKLPSLPKLSISASSRGCLQQQLHAYSSREKPLSDLSFASTSLFGEPDNPKDPISSDGVPNRICRLPGRRRSLEAPRAYKNSFFSLPLPVLSEKPEWWWRTLACIPYLIALQISDTGFFIQPFLEHYEVLGDLIYFVPGAITRLPAWFSMLYCYIAYVGMVKNKDLPHFFRFHLMMGMLLETGLQVIWYTSNFFPLIHYNGRFGMHYWAGVGLAYILILLQCVRCALAGGYAHLPFISDAASIHTLFNIGGFQKPF